MSTPSRSGGWVTFGRWRPQPRLTSPRTVLPSGANATPGADRAKVRARCGTYRDHSRRAAARRPRYPPARGARSPKRQSHPGPEQVPSARTTPPSGSGSPRCRRCRRLPDGDLAGAILRAILGAGFADRGAVATSDWALSSRRGSRAALGPAGVALREIGGLMRAFVALWASAQGLPAGLAVIGRAQLQGRSLGQGEPAAIGASGKTATKRSRATPAPDHDPRGYAHAPISLGAG
jgi:hypothetical protein